MSEQSKTLWEVDGLAISSGNETVCIMGEIDGFESGYKPCKNSDANAALIVRAVNSHEPLMVALRAAYGFFDARADVLFGVDHDISTAAHASQVMASIDAALAALSSHTEQEGGGRG